MVQKTKQYVISPAAGKRMIAKAMLLIPSVREALESRTVVVIAGTTNGYVAEEFLNSIGQSEGFSRKSFFRGITLPPKHEKPDTGKAKDEGGFIGDVVITRGKWEKGKTIFDVADSLVQGDIILKGANAVNLETMQAAVLVGDRIAGTANPTLQCAVGRRVELYVPVGLEKRITGDIVRIARLLNSPAASGVRYMPLPGNVITEIQAIELISGANAELVACGGVNGAEGACWLAVTGNEEQLEKMDALFESIRNEPNFTL